MRNSRAVVCNISHISCPDFFQHSVQPRTLESRSPHSVIGEVPDIRKAVLLGVVLQNTLLEEYSVGRRSIRIRGTFTRKTKDAYGAHQKNAFSKTLWIPRTFPVKQEQILLDFLRKAAANHASFDQHVE